MDEHAVRLGLSSAASAISGLTCTPYVPDSITEPHFFVAESETSFDQAHNRGMDVTEYTCRILVGRATDDGPQRELNAYTSGSGARSLKAALEAARGAPGELALSGACDDFHVVRIQSHRFYDYAGYTYLGCEVLVRVIGSGD